MYKSLHAMAVKKKIASADNLLFTAAMTAWFSGKMSFLFHQPDVHGWSGQGFLHFKCLQMCWMWLVTHIAVTLLKCITHCIAKLASTVFSVQLEYQCVQIFLHGGNQLYTPTYMTGTIFLIWRPKKVGYYQENSNLYCHTTNIHF